MKTAIGVFVVTKLSPSEPITVHVAELVMAPTFRINYKDMDQRSCREAPDHPDSVITALVRSWLCLAWERYLLAALPAGQRLSNSLPAAALQMFDSYLWTHISYSCTHWGLVLLQAKRGPYDLGLN